MWNVLIYGLFYIQLLRSYSHSFSIIPSIASRVIHIQSLRDFQPIIRIRNEEQKRGQHPCFEVEPLFEELIRRKNFEPLKQGYERDRNYNHRQW